MPLKNYMEDVVSDVVDIILKERKLILNNLAKRDVIAYSLNRLPAKYIVSERGFTHSILEENNNPDFHNDIIEVINEAIEVVISRPREYSEKESDKKGPFTFDGNRYFNFPHFIGEVLEINKLTTIQDVKIILYLDDKLCEMEEPSWINPYITKKATDKFYSFWPKAICLKQGEEIEQSFSFRIRFEHPDYYPNEKEVILLIEAEDRKYNYIRRNYTELIDIATLEKREQG